MKWEGWSKGNTFSDAMLVLTELMCKSLNLRHFLPIGMAINLSRSV